MRRRRRHRFHGAHLHRSRQEEQAEPGATRQLGPASTACPEQPCLFSAASAQSVLLHGQCGRQISPCPHQPVHSQPRKRQRLKRSRESGGGQREASEQKHSQRAAASRQKNTFCCECVCWAGTYAAVGWVSLIDELAAQPRQRGQFIH